jgi:hypothetical protein
LGLGKGFRIGRRCVVGPLSDGAPGNEQIGHAGRFTPGKDSRWIVTLAVE